MPGMVDTHTHQLNELRLDGTTLEGLRASTHLELPLRTGLTTFRDLGSAYGDEAALEQLRAALAEHDTPIPTVVIAGPLITQSGSEALRLWPEQAIGVTGESEAAAATLDLINSGVDQIKVFIDEDLRGTATSSLGEVEIAAIVAAAHDHGMWVTAHVSTESEAWLALQNGVDGLAHWPGHGAISDEMIEALVAAGTPVATSFKVSPPAKGDLRRLLDAGVRVVLGTDAPGAGSAVATWRELDLMVQAGATPMEAIIASTRDAAYAVGLGDEIGTIEVGKRADLLLVGADPAQDVTVLSDLIAVIKDGVLVG